MVGEKAVRHEISRLENSEFCRSIALVQRMKQIIKGNKRIRRYVLLLKELLLDLHFEAMPVGIIYSYLKHILIEII